MFVIFAQFTLAAVLHGDAAHQPGAHDDLSTFVAEMPSDDYKLRDVVQNIKSIGKQTDEKLDGIRNRFKVPVLQNTISLLETKGRARDVDDDDDDDTSDDLPDRSAVPDLDALDETPEAQRLKRKISSDMDTLHDQESEIADSMRKWNHEVGNLDDDEANADEELEREGERLGESDGIFDRGSSFLETEKPSGLVFLAGADKKLTDLEERQRTRLQYKLDHSREGWLQNMTGLMHRSRNFLHEFRKGHDRNMLKLKQPSSFLEFSSEESLRDGEAVAEKAFDRMLQTREWLDADRKKLREGQVARKEAHEKFRSTEHQQRRMLVQREKTRRESLHMNEHHRTKKHQ